MLWAPYFWFSVMLHQQSEHNIQIEKNHFKNSKGCYKNSQVQYTHKNITDVKILLELTQLLAI